MSRGARERIATGLYRDVCGLAAVVTVGDQRRERRFPPSQIDRAKIWQDETRAQLRKFTTHPERGTFAADARRYLAAVSGMTGIVQRTREMDAWVAAFGHRYRDQIAPAEIRAQLETWRAAHRWTASTCNHYRTALQHLWSVLDGKGERNPVRSIPRYREPDAVPRGLPWATIRLILRAMPPSVTRIRLALMATTGMLHSTLGQVTRADVDVDRRVYRHPGRGKGAGARPRLLPLNRRAAYFFRLLDRVEGWGPIHRGPMRTSFRRGCREAERRAASKGQILDLSGVRVADLRHSYAFQVLQATADLQTTKELLAHESLSTTLRYTRSALSPALAEAGAKVDRVLAIRRGTGPSRL